MRYNRGMDAIEPESENRLPDAVPEAGAPAGQDEAARQVVIRETAGEYGVRPSESGRPGAYGGGWLLPPFDSNRAREAGRKGNERRKFRREVAKLQAMRGWRTAVASIEPGIGSFWDAFRASVGQVALQIHENGDARAFRELSIAAGLRDKDAADGQASGVHIGISVTGDVAADLVQALLDRAGR